MKDEEFAYLQPLHVLVLVWLPLVVVTFIILNNGQNPLFFDSSIFGTVSRLHYENEKN